MTGIGIFCSLPVSDSAMPASHLAGQVQMAIFNLFKNEY
jgi:hypothetical protein